MSAATAIVAQLNANSAVTAIVGNRIMPELSEQTDAFPQIVYTATQEEPQPSHGGPSALIKQNIVIDVIGERYGDVENLASAVRAALDYQRGTWAGTVVQGCFLEDEADNVEFIGQTATYPGKEMTFSVNFQR